MMNKLMWWNSFILGCCFVYLFSLWSVFITVADSISIAEATAASSTAWHLAPLMTCVALLTALLNLISSVYQKLHSVNKWNRFVHQGVIVLSMVGMLVLLVSAAVLEYFGRVEVAIIMGIARWLIFYGSIGYIVLFVIDVLVVLLHKNKA